MSGEGLDDKISFKGRHWALPDNSPHDIGDVRRDNHLDLPTAKVLLGRGIAPDKIPDFLDPKLKNLLPDPYFFKDMEVAVKHLSRCVQQGEKIGIFSDYDADGATSAAILGRCLRMFGHDKFHLKIPDRATEGYGPNTPALLDMKNTHGCDTICILDSGSLAFEPIKAATGAGIDIVVVDHHATEDTNPEGLAIINPNRKDQPAGFGDLCAAGMVFILCVGLARELGQTGFLDGEGARPSRMPNLMELLDLVALGTVADVVPLSHPLNRAFVVQGLKALNVSPSMGIVALATASGLQQNAEISEKDCGWIFGPRINAGGRIGNSEAGARLLLETSPDAARALAEYLDEQNQLRRDIDAEATAAVLEQFGDWVPGRDRDVAVAVVEAHEGVVGISAGRLKEALDAPAIVLTPTKEGLLKGSARSVPGFDIGAAVMAAHKEGLALKAGGHAMAGGITLRKDQLEGLKAFLSGEIRKTDYFHNGISSRADLQLTLSEMQLEVLERFEKLRPFGAQNPAPSVILENIVPVDIRILKEKHFKITFRDGDQSIDGLIWGAVGTQFGRQIEEALNMRVDLLGEPQINEFNNRKSRQIIVEDMRFCETALL